MNTLTEKSTYQDLLSAWKEVNDYGERAANAKAVKDALKKSNVTYRRVNTPAKHRAFYIIIKTKKRMYHMPFLIVEGSEGDSFVALEDETVSHCLTVLHSHAIRRYIERRGWKGTVEQCEEYLLDAMWVTARNRDKYTKEITVYFDEGIFLGCVKGNICHLNTYVANQHLYPYQRLKSRQLQESIEELIKNMRNK